MYVESVIKGRNKVSFVYNILLLNKFPYIKSSKFIVNIERK